MATEKVYHSNVNNDVLASLWKELKLNVKSCKQLGQGRDFVTFAVSSGISTVNTNNTQSNVKDSNSEQSKSYVIRVARRESANNLLINELQFLKEFNFYLTNIQESKPIPNAPQQLLTMPQYYKSEIKTLKIAQENFLCNAGIYPSLGTKTVWDLDTSLYPFFEGKSYKDILNYDCYAPKKRQNQDMKRKQSRQEEKDNDNVNDSGGNGYDNYNQLGYFLALLHDCQDWKHWNFVDNCKDKGDNKVNNVGIPIVNHKEKLQYIIDLTKHCLSFLNSFIKKYENFTASKNENKSKNTNKNMNINKNKSSKVKVDNDKDNDNDNNLDIDYYVVITQRDINFYDLIVIYDASIKFVSNLEKNLKNDKINLDFMPSTSMKENDIFDSRVEMKTSSQQHNKYTKQNKNENIDIWNQISITHGDLHFAHLILHNDGDGDNICSKDNSKCGLNGIIDWSDVTISDGASDFRQLWCMFDNWIEKSNYKKYRIELFEKRINSNKNNCNVDCNKIDFEYGWDIFYKRCKIYAILCCMCSLWWSIQIGTQCDWCIKITSKILKQYLIDKPIQFNCK